MNVRTLALLAACLCASAPAAVSAQSTPAPSPAATSAATAPASPSAASPVPGPSPSAAVTSRAREWLNRILTGSIDRSQLDAKMSAALTDAQAKQLSTQLAPLGSPTAFTFIDSQVAQGVTVYRYRATFKSVTATWAFALDSDGKIGGMFLRPSQ